MAAIPSIGTTQESVIDTVMTGLNVIRTAAGYPALTHIEGGALRWQHDGLADTSWAAHIVWDDTPGGIITEIDGQTDRDNPAPIGMDRAHFLVACWSDTQPHARALMWQLCLAMERYCDERTMPRPWQYRVRAAQGSTSTGYCYDVLITIAVDIPSELLETPDVIYQQTGTLNGVSIPAFTWDYPPPT